MKLNYTFMASTPTVAMLVYVADNLKKPHHIATFWVIEIVNDHSNTVVLIMLLILFGFLLFANNEQKNDFVRE